MAIFWAVAVADVLGHESVDTTRKHLRSHQTCGDATIEGLRI